MDSDGAGVIRERLTRERVLEVAQQVVDRGERVTMRGLARDLGVAPMTLYGHVRNRDDLLDALVDRLLGSSWRPSDSTTDPAAWIAEAAERFWTLLFAERSARYIYLTKPVTAPVARERMTAMLEMLGRCGVPEDRRLDAYATIHIYTLGFAAIAASRQGASQEVRGELAQSLSSFTSVESFRRGLRTILHGLGIEVPAEAPASV